MRKQNFPKVDQGSFAGTLYNALFWFISILFMETLLHIVLFSTMAPEFLYAVGFSVVIALIISGLTAILPTRGNKTVSIIVMTVLSIFYCSQIVYNAVFGTMYSVSLVALGGAALTSFWKETLLTIWNNFPILLAMLLPIPVTAVLAAKCKPVFNVRRNWIIPAQLALAIVLNFAIVFSLGIGGTEDYSTYYFYHSSDATTDQCTERFGLLTTLRLELFVSGSGSDSADSYEDDSVPDFVIEEVSLSDIPEQSVVSSSEPVTEEPEYNMLEIDFDYLNSLTNDEKILQLNSYISSLTPSKKNSYTGLLSDYNLITICAESFDTGAIREDLTPTLYKLASEGFIFDNYYNTYPNVTTDGEYSFCLGMMPDISRQRKALSFYTTRNSYLPFALGNIFHEQAGIDSYAYHNYIGEYYNRNLTHPNMGYKCKFADAGMSFTTDWPSSDLEMFEQSTNDYITSGKQFHAYYMTFSGHFMYSRTANPMAKRNYETVYHLGLDISEASKCYLSCNYELEKALAYLMSELEKAGIADQTAIVIAGDHFPYGLKDYEYAELVDHEVEGLTKYKSSLIFWVGGMENPVHVNEYMCNIDILPTILNLWGFSYDSRLLNGTDVMSDSEHIAILRDKSFLTDVVWFNASTGKAEWLGGETSADEVYLERMKNKVNNIFNSGSTMLSTSYYDFLLDTGGVAFGKKEDANS